MGNITFFCSDLPRGGNQHTHAGIYRFYHGHQKDFSWGIQKDFYRATNSGEISFYVLETNRTSLFAKNLIGNYKSSKSRGESPSPSDAHCLCTFCPSITI